MELTKGQQQAHDIMNSIYAKCWEDKAFKQNLMDSPVQTLEQFLGQPLNIPEGSQLVINDQSDKTFIHINIPSKPNLENLELTEEQLELVAGGCDPIGWLVDKYNEVKRILNISII